MKSLENGKYSDSQVREQLFYKNASRQIAFRFDLLDINEVKQGTLGTVTGEISHSSLAQVKRTAKFNLTEYDKKNINFLNDRIQPFFILQMPDGGYCEWPLGIFLLTSPTVSGNGTSKSRSIEAYDKSVILEQDKFSDRYLVRKGQNCVNAAINIISSAGLFANIPAHSGVLNADKEFTVGTSKITAANEILRVVNYDSVRIGTMGDCVSSPYVLPEDREDDHIYTNENLSVLGANGSETQDIYDIGNVFVRVATSPELETPLRAEYVNDNPQSVLSTVNRQRRIVDYEEINDISSQATLNGYVRRIASEASQIYSKVKFQTALMPHHDTSDTIYLDHPILESPGKYTETNWTLPLSAGSQMTHEARRVMYL